MKTSNENKPANKPANKQANKPANKHETKYWLTVTAGSQRGTRVEIDPVQGTTIGSDIECDIVLQGAGIAAQAATIRSENNKPGIELLDGTLECAGAALTVRKAERLQTGTPYSLGAVQFVIHTDETIFASAREISRHVADEANGTQASIDTKRQPRNSDVESRPDPSVADLPESRVLPFSLMVIAVLLCVSIGVSYLMHQSNSSTTNAALKHDKQVSGDALATVLAQAGYDGIQVNENNGRVLVRGYVEDTREARALKQLVAARFPAVLVQVHAQSEIVSGVRDVYRTNGIDAVVESAGPGAIKVITAEKDAPDPAFLRAAAKNDVAGLVKLDSINEMPEAADESTVSLPVPTPGSVEDGKRVMAVVQGQPSYVVTEDSGRYFVGSRLPTGHTIQHIESNEVLLDYEGQQVKLQF